MQKNNCQHIRVQLTEWDLEDIQKNYLWYYLKCKQPLCENTTRQCCKRVYAIGKQPSKNSVREKYLSQIYYPCDESHFRQEIIYKYKQNRWQTPIKSFYEFLFSTNPAV
ncbi:unnamed protein product [Paramecium octaurelia]|uniref:Uncharacterized protein n=1 Tax=Paramecium octaurelia TaxID=43137 RepID=A0A8S1YQI4_PAROT|nr:unnamed protein product [Paramecium octaurelia]CAD8213834.1 unnamed protein product [Paramecium octaurelia]